MAFMIITISMRHNHGGHFGSTLAGRRNLAIKFINTTENERLNTQPISLPIGSLGRTSIHPGLRYTDRQTKKRPH